MNNRIENILSKIVAIAIARCFIYNSYKLTFGEIIRMRLVIYNALVNRVPGIRDRYHNLHDGASAFVKIISWLYLLWLNFAYYVLFYKAIGKDMSDSIYENKKLLVDSSESAKAFSGDVQEIVNELMKYDIVSFDIFDTLILRPFDEPTALFHLLANEIGLMDFRRIRMEAEADARRLKFKQDGTYEVTFDEIWDLIECRTSLKASHYKNIELELELSTCFANPFMLQVFQKLKEQGKRIIITSDMYLSAEFLSTLLAKNGFAGYEKLYVSNELGRSKAKGDIWNFILSDLNITPNQLIHVGDNETSDVKLVRKNKINSLYYPNFQKYALSFRAYDMEPIIGAAYRGMVGLRIYGSGNRYSKDYEYGYIYGGLFVLGYCHFIHEYVLNNNVDKILFLSRDGDILKQVYDYVYPGENTEYVLWSRKVSTKLMACFDRYDFLRRFVDHKVGKDFSINSIFMSMEQSDLLEQFLSDNPDLDENILLTEKIAKRIKTYLTDNWSKVIDKYDSENEAACKYYSSVLAGASKAVAVDIGWAGSGAISLDYLVNAKWKMQCPIIGLVAGTNTIHNFEPYATEPFILTQKLVPYMYSMSHNRDLMRLHNPNLDFNLYWELLLSSTKPHFQGFNMEENGDVGFKYGNKENNIKGIEDIQQGIKDFAEDYMAHFKEFDFMLNISGRDAYAPMIVAASKNERYLKAVYKGFNLDMDVN